MKKNYNTKGLLVTLCAIIMMFAYISDVYAAGKMVLVMAVQAPNVNKDIRDILMDSFIGELNKSKKYQFINQKIYQAAFDEAMKEQGQECDAIKCVKKVAGAYGINLVLSTKIIKEGSTYYLNAKVEDLTSGVQVEYADDTCSDCKDTKRLRDIMVKLARALGGLSDNTVAAPSAPAASTPGALGFLTVTGEPFGAEVYINGNLIGKMPITKYTLNVGRNLLTVKNPLYTTIQDKAIVINAGVETIIPVNLTTNFGTLSVDSDPQEADIELDGKSIGTTPIKNYKLNPSSYQIKLKKNGYIEREYHVSIMNEKEFDIPKAQAILEKKIFSVQISANPSKSGAEVYVDGVKMGTAPMLVEKLAEGSHTVVLKHGNYIGTADITGTQGVTKDVVVNMLLNPQFSNDVMFTFGTEQHISRGIGYLVAEYSHVLNNAYSDAWAMRFLYNGHDIGGGISVRFAFDPPIFDNGLYWGIGINGIKEFTGFFVTPKVELGYSLYLGPISFTIEAGSGYTVAASVPAVKFGKPYAGGFDYNVGAKFSFTW